MTTLWYRPFENFTGFVGSNQENITKLLSFTDSSNFEDKTYYDASSAFNYSFESPAALYDDSKGDRYLQFHFNYHSFFITHYELMQRTDSSTANFMDTWKLEGSNDNKTWTLLDTRTSDADFKRNGQIRLFPTKKGSYNYFKLSEIKDILLVVQQIDVYGFLCETREQCKLSYLFMKTQSNTINLRFSHFTLIFFIS